MQLIADNEMFLDIQSAAWHIRKLADQQIELLTRTVAMKSTLHFVGPGLPVSMLACRLHAGCMQAFASNQTFSTSFNQMREGVKYPWEQKSLQGALTSALRLVQKAKLLYIICMRMRPATF